MTWHRSTGRLTWTSCRRILLRQWLQWSRRSAARSAPRSCCHQHTSNRCYTTHERQRNTHTSDYTLMIVCIFARRSSEDTMFNWCPFYRTSNLPDRAAVTHQMHRRPNVIQTFSNLTHLSCNFTRVKVRILASAFDPSPVWAASFFRNWARYVKTKITVLYVKVIRLCLLISDSLVQAPQTSARKLGPRKNKC